MFRKKDKAESENEAPSRGEVDPAKLSAQEAELAKMTPGVRYVRRQLFAAHNEREKIVTDHLQAIHEPGGLAARKQASDFMELGTPHSYLDALSEIEFTIDELVLTTQQQVAARWTVKGLHVAELHGVPPSGQPVTLTGVTILVMQDKFILSDYTYFDFPELTRRASQTATPPAPGA